MMDDEDEAKAPEKGDIPKKAAQQGWGSPSAKASDEFVRETKPEEADDDDQPKGRRRNLRDVQDDQEELVVMIPDLEEEGETEDITLQVSAAPRNIARRLPSLEQVSFVPVACSPLHISTNLDPIEW